MKTRDSQTSDVIIIGGGATGAGIARDCALRGLRVILVERHDIATGATGRNHGLLHSGARYAVTDAESARECISENQILKRIARHCVEPTDGLFITLPEDDLAFQATFIRACEAAGIRAEAIDPQQARIIEPSVNPALIGAVKVPDGTVDPFRLTAANMLDAREHGAIVLTAHEVTGSFVKAQRSAASMCATISLAKLRRFTRRWWSMRQVSGGNGSPNTRPEYSHVPGERLAVDHGPSDQPACH